MSEARIRPADPRAPGAAGLLAASQAVMHASSPPEARNHFPIDRLAAPDVLFLIAGEEPDPQGCVAVARREGYGEVKSMFVRADRRGSGLADRLLSHVEAEARGLGLGLMRLETGTGLQAALRFYRRNGCRYRGPFGDYRPTPRSLYMEKPL